MSPSIPNLRDDLSALGLPEAEALLSPHWEESCRALPAEGPPFLLPDELRASLDFCGLSDEARQVAETVTGHIRSNAALGRLLWHCHRLAFVHLDYPAASLARCPEPEGALGEHAGAFFLLAVLGAVPAARRNDGALGIPEQVTKAGLHDIAIGIDRYARWHPGRVGLMARHVYWFRNHVHHNLYRLGRLQYVVRPFAGQLTAYRHAGTGQVLAMAEAGLRFDRDGFRAHPDARAGCDGCWESTLEEEDAGARGHPIAPDGRARSERVLLSAGQWEPVLSRGDPVLEMHIPEGGGMTIDRCEASMREALTFFPRYFPDNPFKALACQSWIMNPEYADFYSPEANFVRYQRELYLYPTSYASTGGVFFIFDAHAIDPATSPRDTSLRRAMVDHVAAGGILRNGGMFFLPEHMDRFGTQPYRTQPLFDWLRSGDRQRLSSVGISPA